MQKRTLIVTGIVSLIFFAACDNKKEVKYVEVEKVKPLSCKMQEDYTIPDNRVVQQMELKLKRKHQYVRRYDCSGKIISEKLEVTKEKKADIELFAKGKVKGKDYKQVLEKLSNIRASAYNRQTCQSTQRDPLSIINDGLKGMISIITFPVKIYEEQKIREASPSIKFTIDMSPALFTTEGINGVQMIDYQFTQVCNKSKDDKNFDKQNRPRKTAKIDKKSRGRSYRDKKKSEADTKPIKDERLCNKEFEQGTLVLAVSYEDVELDQVKIVKPTNCK